MAQKVGEAVNIVNMLYGPTKTVTVQKGIKFLIYDRY